LDHEKPRFSIFRQNGGQNYFRFQFSVQIRVLHLDLVDQAQNLKKKDLSDTFSEILGQKFKNYLNELQKLFTREFFTFCGSYAPQSVSRIWLESV